MNGMLIHMALMLNGWLRRRSKFIVEYCSNINIVKKTLNSKSEHMAKRVYCYPDRSTKWWFVLGVYLEKLGTR